MKILIGLIFICNAHAQFLTEDQAKRIERENNTVQMSFDEFMKAKSIGIEIGKIYKVSGIVYKDLGGYTLSKPTAEAKRYGLALGNNFTFYQTLLNQKAKSDLYDLKKKEICLSVSIAGGKLYAQGFSSGSCN